MESDGLEINLDFCLFMFRVCGCLLSPLRTPDFITHYCWPPSLGDPTALPTQPCGQRSPPRLRPGLLLIQSQMHVRCPPMPSRSRASRPIHGVTAGSDAFRVSPFKILNKDTRPGIGHRAGPSGRCGWPRGPEHCSPSFSPPPAAQEASLESDGLEHNLELLGACLLLIQSPISGLSDSDRPENSLECVTLGFWCHSGLSPEREYRLYTSLSDASPLLVLHLLCAGG